MGNSADGRIEAFNNIIDALLPFEKEARHNIMHAVLHIMDGVPQKLPGESKRDPRQCPTEMDFANTANGLTNLGWEYEEALAAVMAEYEKAPNKALADLGKCAHDTLNEAARVARQKNLNEASRIKG